MPVLTVVIPTYNAANTLVKALQSLKQQTWQDFEVIIQDGLSNDRTIELALSFKMHCNFQMQIFSEKDNGIYDAMNKAIQKAKGSWLYFLGADDHIHSNDVFEKLSTFLMDNNLDYLYGNVCSPNYGACYDGPFDFKKLKIKNICHQAIFYRKSLFQTLGTYNLRYKVLADWDFNLRCFIHPQVKVKHVDTLIAYFAPDGFGIRVKDYAFANDKEQLLNNYFRLYKPLVFWKKKIMEFPKRGIIKIANVFRNLFTLL